MTNRVHELEKLLHEARGTLTAVTLTLEGPAHDDDRTQLVQLVRGLDAKFAAALHTGEVCHAG